MTTQNEGTQRDELARIKASVEGHTEGPWEVAADLPTWESEEGGFDVGPEDAPAVAVVEGLADAELIAAAPKLLAALEAIEELHSWSTVYALTDEGYLDYDKPIMRFCTQCTPADTTADIDDGQWTEDAETVRHPCPTVRAITKALA